MASESGVDSPQDVYRVSRILRQKSGAPFAVPFTKKDQLNALYIGIGALPADPFYDAMWSALEQRIGELEVELLNQPDCERRP